MIDFRSRLYALSDVIKNRPRPLRIFDQIDMKLPDMLLGRPDTSRPPSVPTDRARIV